MVTIAAVALYFVMGSVTDSESSNWDKLPNQGDEDSKGQDKEIYERIIYNTPHVSRPIAVASALSNLLIPGFGTCLSAVCNKNGYSKTQFIIAFL